MILREYKTKDTTGKNRIFVEVRCDCCEVSYIRQKRQLKETHGCSPKCLSYLKGTRVKVICSHCGLEHDKKKSSLANSKSGLYFCSRTCHNEASRYIEAIMPKHYGSCEGNYRKKALDNYGPQCNRCGYNSNIAAIEVYHIDRNRNNNKIYNLEVLCANCHSIEHLSGKLYGTAS